MAIKERPIGTKEDYAPKHESGYLAGATRLSPSVQVIVREALRKFLRDATTAGGRMH
jgi:hypothetical protein